MPTQMHKKTSVTRTFKQAMNRSWEEKHWREEIMTTSHWIRRERAEHISAEGGRVAEVTKIAHTLMRVHVNWGW